MSEECYKIACSEKKNVTVVFGDQEPFERQFCKMHARDELGKHDDASIEGEPDR